MNSIDKDRIPELPELEMQLAASGNRVLSGLGHSDSFITFRQITNEQARSITNLICQNHPEANSSNTYSIIRSLIGNPHARENNLAELILTNTRIESEVYELVKLKEKYCPNTELDYLISKDTRRILVSQWCQGSTTAREDLESFFIKASRLTINSDHNLFSVIKLAQNLNSDHQSLKGLLDTIDIIEQQLSRFSKYFSKAETPKDNKSDLVRFLLGESSHLDYASILQSVLRLEARQRDLLLDGIEKVLQEVSQFGINPADVFYNLTTRKIAVSINKNPLELPSYFIDAPSYLKRLCVSIENRGLSAEKATEYSTYLLEKSLYIFSHLKPTLFSDLVESLPLLVSKTDNHLEDKEKKLILSSLHNVNVRQCKVTNTTISDLVCLSYIEQEISRLKIPIGEISSRYENNDNQYYDLTSDQKNIPFTAVLELIQDYEKAKSQNDKKAIAWVISNSKDPDVRSCLENPRLKETLIEVAKVITAIAEKIPSYLNLSKKLPFQEGISPQDFLTSFELGRKLGIHPGFIAFFPHIAMPNIQGATVDTVFNDTSDFKFYLQFLVDCRKYQDEEAKSIIESIALKTAEESSSVYKQSLALSAAIDSNNIDLETFCAPFNENPSLGKAVELIRQRHLVKDASELLSLLLEKSSTLSPDTHPDAELYDALCNEILILLQQNETAFHFGQIQEKKPFTQSFARNEILYRAMSPIHRAKINIPYEISIEDLQWCITEVPELYKMETLTNAVMSTNNINRIFPACLDDQFGKYLSIDSILSIGKRLESLEDKTYFARRMLELELEDSVTGGMPRSWPTSSAGQQSYKNFLEGFFNVIQKRSNLDELYAKYGKDAEALICKELPTLDVDVRSSAFSGHVYEIAINSDLPEEIRTKAATCLLEANVLESFLFNQQSISSTPAINKLSETFRVKLEEQLNGCKDILRSHHCEIPNTASTDPLFFPDISILAKAGTSSYSDYSRLEGGTGFRNMIIFNIYATNYAIKACVKYIRFSRLLNSDPSRHPIPSAEVQIAGYKLLAASKPESLKLLPQLFGILAADSITLHLIQDGVEKSYWPEEFSTHIKTESFRSLYIRDVLENPDEAIAMIYAYGNAVGEYDELQSVFTLDRADAENRFISLVIDLILDKPRSDSDVREFISCIPPTIDQRQRDIVIKKLGNYRTINDPANIHFYQAEILKELASSLPFQSINGVRNNSTLICLELLARYSFSRERCEIFKGILLNQSIPLEIRKSAGLFFKTHSILSDEAINTICENDFDKENDKTTVTFDLLETYLSLSEQTTREKLTFAIEAIINDTVSPQNFSKVQETHTILPNILLIAACALSSTTVEILDLLRKCSDEIDETMASRIAQNLLFLKSNNLEEAMPEALSILTAYGLSEFITELDKLSQLGALFDSDLKLALSYSKDSATLNKKDRSSLFQSMLAQQLEKLFGESPIDAYEKLLKIPGFLDHIITFLSKLESKYKYQGHKIGSIAREGHLDSFEHWRDWRFYGDGSEQIRSMVPPTLYNQWTKGAATWVGVFDDIQDRTDRGIASQLRSAIEYGHVSHKGNNPALLKLESLLKKALEHPQTASLAYIDRLLLGVDNLITHKEIFSQGKNASLADNISSIQVGEKLTDKILEGPIRRFRSAIGRRFANRFPDNESLVSNPVWTIEHQTAAIAIIEKIKESVTNQLGNPLLEEIEISDATERSELYITRKALGLARKFVQLLNHDNFASDATTETITNLNEIIISLSDTFKNSPLLADLQAISSRIKLKKDNNDTNRHIIIETSLPDMSALSGKYPVNSGSCQNLETGSYRQGLMGYILDPQIKVIYVLDERKVSEELNDILRNGDFENALWDKNAEELLKAAQSRAIIRIGATEADKQSAIVIEPIYTSGLLSKSDSESMILDHIKANYLGHSFRVFKSNGSEEVRISKSRNDWGQYDDYIGAKGNTGSYTVKLTRVYTGVSEQADQTEASYEIAKQRSHKALRRKFAKNLTADFTNTKIARFGAAEYRQEYEPLLKELGADIIIIHNPSIEDRQTVTSADGYFFKPEKINWRIDVNTFDTYLESLNAKRRSNLKSRLGKSEFALIESGPLTKADFAEWYKVYDSEVAGKERGRRVIEHTWASNKKSLAEYKKIFFRDPETKELLGGAILKISAASKKLTIAYAAYKPQGRELGLSYRTFKEAFEFASNNHLNTLSYGMDSNLYGHYLSVGLYEYKSSLGFTPHAAKSDQLVKVLNPSQLNNNYAFMAYDQNGNLELIRNV